MKKTIAILGDSGEFSSELYEVLMKQDLRLLFVSEDEAKYERLKEQLNPSNAVAEIEFHMCQREGCWEADIIVLNYSEVISSALTEKIKEVATQKIVLKISEDDKKFEKPELEKLLPLSKVVTINFDHYKKEFSVFGKDSEAKAEVLKILLNLDYQLKG